MQNYNFLQKQLHRLILGKQFLKKTLFDIEKSLFYKKLQNVKEQQHIFITGLPRSGTTILLEFFHQTKEFASLTYADMPFVLAPNLFSKISKKRNIQSQERMHQDGIKFDLNSPEAFDDVFFQIFNNEESKENLEIFVSLVLQRYKKYRYLSKNNNNYKRIELILSVFPGAIILIPYREPLQHAYSLLRQHKLFCQMQKKDKFVLEYMNFLGHNEFGLHYKSWNLPKKYIDPFSLNHWLEQWYLFYQNIIHDNTKTKNTILISYNGLCKNHILVQKLISKTNLNEINNLNFFRLSEKNISIDYNKYNLSRCYEIFDKMENLSNNLIN